MWHGVVDGMVAECGPDVLNTNVKGGTITSVGSIYAHMVWSEDMITNGMLQGKPLIYQSDGWAAKTGIALPDGGNPEVKEEWARPLKMDLPKFQEYAKAVFSATDAYLGSVSEADLGRKIQTPIGEQTVGWAIAVLLGTHYPQHAGEIAALKGVHGLKGLPF
jgi:hypothetical protein